MRASSPSNLVSQMIARATHTEDSAGEDDVRPASRVTRIVWTAQAEKLRPSLSHREMHEIECAVTMDLDSLELPEVFFTSVEACGYVVTCDLDQSGTASVFGLIDAREYDDLVEEAGDDALFGVDWDGIYVNPARTRH